MTEPELKEKLKEIFPQVNVNKIEIYSWEDDRVNISLKTNDPISIGFSVLKKIGELFQTESVNVNQSEYGGMCSTCDYGRVYECTFHVSRIPEDYKITK